MQTIVACRSQISDRFPVASFAIQLPPSRFYEVACATDPRLFHSRHRRDRTRTNFFTSREHGLLHAPRGETAWMIPPDQLQRFAGARRVYYALGSYGSPRGDDAHFTIAPSTLDQVPSISLAQDFTGRSLDRSRIGHARASGAEYGGAPVDLVWGGDYALDAEAQRAQDEQSPAAYDDGHDSSLWQQGQSAGSDSASDDPMVDPEQLSADPPMALAIADEAAAQCNDVPVDSFSADEYSHHRDGTTESYGAIRIDDFGATYGGSVAADRDDEDVDETSGLGLTAIENDGDDLEDTNYGGYEDGAALYNATYGGTETAEEFYADASALEEEPVDDATMYGGSATAIEDPPVDEGEFSGSLAAEVGGRDPEYRHDEDFAEGADFDGAIALAVRPLDITEKVRVLRVVARAESGRDGYSAINPDNEYNDPKHPAYRKYHIGLSWGFIQFTQRSGMLGKVLQAAHRRSEAGVPPADRFESLFGPDWRQLLEVTNAKSEEARLAPVGGQPLWDRTWTERFRRAGAVTYITAAQNEVAIREFVDRIEPVAAWLGFKTPRALAMLCDRVIHMGVGGGLAWVLANCGPLKSDAQRRQALEALGVADLAAFQRTKAPHLRADNKFGPRVHAALVSALRRLGPKSPIAIPGPDVMLRQLADAAASRGFANRFRALFNNRIDFDESTAYDLAEV